MNGRIYDPLLGRFLSSDRYVQFPNDLQSYNRYSYVLNNPLTHNDPSGYAISVLVVGGAVLAPEATAAVLAALGLAAWFTVDSVDDGTIDGSPATNLANSISASDIMDTASDNAHPAPSNEERVQNENVETEILAPEERLPTDTGTPVDSQPVESESIIVPSESEAGQSEEFAPEPVESQNPGTPADQETPQLDTLGSQNSTNSQTGSYTNHHASGKKYHGKGSRARSQSSGRRVERQTGDQHTATEWGPSATNRDAMKDESVRLDADGGAKSDANHHAIESPGKKYRE